MEINNNLVEFKDCGMPNLKELEEYAKQNYIPICRPSLANYLYFASASKKPNCILEIGTAIGYSGIIMAKGSPKSKITTIEIDSNRLNIALQNFEKFGVNAQINALCGDAGDIIFNLEEESFDMIFLDGPKTHYYAYLSSIKRLLTHNGILIADNIFQNGKTIGTAEVENKDKSTIINMIDFVDVVANDADFTSTILPFGDGVLLATKK